MAEKREDHLSVIVPAHRCVPALEQALRALAGSDLPRSRWELIVVDDDSGDDTADVAARTADRVVRLTAGPHGPAYARNRGAAAANGTILVFVDADVCVHPDALRRIIAHFQDAPDLGAVFGTYDEQPHARGLVSQYRNLVHRWVHVRNAGAAHTFWAGCGAVRRSAFTQVNGFDHVRYARPQIEDIELGHRLAAAGWRIVLDPAIQATHLKRWTLRGGVVTDVRDRGVPWAELMMAERSAGHASALNLRPAEKLATGLIGAAVLAAAIAVAMRDTRIATGSALLAVAGLVPSIPLLRWLARQRGVPFALAAVPLRLLYYAGNVASVCAAMALRIGHGRNRAAPRAGAAPTVIKR